MSLLEGKVDSAVASHEAAEVAKRTVKQGPASQAEPCAEEPPSTAASASDGMEEIDTGPAVPGPSLTREGPQHRSCTTSCEALSCIEEYYCCHWSSHCIAFRVCSALQICCRAVCQTQSRCMRIKFWPQRSGHILRVPSCLHVVAGPVDDSKMKSVVGPGTMPSQQQSQFGGGSTR